MGYASDYLSRLKEAIDSINTDQVDEIVEILDKARNEERQVFVVGNGGSAAVSSHFFTDMAKGAYNESRKNFKIMSLCDNVPIITALANDYSVDDIFVGQLRVYFQPGDVVFAISSSGNSPNVIKAVEYANKNGGVTIGLCGFKGGKLAELAHKSVYIPYEHYGLAEDTHGIITHIVCYYFMEKAGTMPPLAGVTRVEG